MGNGWPRSTHRGTCAHKAQARVWPELHCIQRISAFPRPSFQVSGLRKSEEYLAWPLPNVLWEKAAKTFGRFASSPVFMPRACPLTHNLGFVSCMYRMVRRKHIVFTTLSTLSVEIKQCVVSKATSWIQNPLAFDKLHEQILSCGVRMSCCKFWYSVWKTNISCNGRNFSVYACLGVSVFVC